MRYIIFVLFLIAGCHDYHAPGTAECTINNIVYKFDVLDFYVNGGHAILRFTSEFPYKSVIIDPNTCKFTEKPIEPVVQPNYIYDFFWAK